MTNDSPPEWEKLFSALGRLTYAWSAIDTFLDLTNNVLYHEFGGKAIEPVLPHSSLEMKINFFQQCVSKSDLIKNNKVALQMADKLVQMRDERHWVIHGMCMSMQDETITLLRSRLKLKKNETKKVTFDDLQDFYERSLLVLVGLSFFLAFNLKAMPREKHAEFLRSLTVEAGFSIEFGELACDGLNKLG